MTDYKITLPDGTIVEAPTRNECVKMAKEMRDEGDLITDRTIFAGNCDTTNSNIELSGLDVLNEKFRQEMREFNHL